MAASESWDDVQWVALAWLRAYNLTKQEAYLQRALFFYDMVVEKAWDDTVCGGGLWWSGTTKYKNAITNELFLELNMRLYDMDPSNTTYLNWAIRGEKGIPENLFFIRET